MQLLELLPRRPRHVDSLGGAWLDLEGAGLDPSRHRGRVTPDRDSAMTANVFESKAFSRINVDTVKISDTTVTCPNSRQRAICPTVLGSYPPRPPLRRLPASTKSVGIFYD